MEQLLQFTTKEIRAVLSALRTSEAGLTAVEARHRLRTYGPNEIAAREAGWFYILQRQFRSSFIYLLIVAALISFALGQVIDGSMIVLFVLINSGIGFYQEFRSERTLKLLKQYVVRRARVRRDGKEFFAASKELVPGDIVVMEPGDIVSADLRVVDGTNLLTDESILTGESAPAHKNASAQHHQASEIFEARNMLFSGTTVVSGKGVGVVVATGKKSLLSDIARLAVETERVSSFTKSIHHFSAVIMRMVLSTLGLIIAANIFIKGFGVDIPELLIFGIALAVSVIPEALPVVTTFSLSRGALRLSKHHVVVKRLSAIEDLGSIEVLATDKTGTLTENVLTVADTFGAGDTALIFLAGLASPFLGEREKQPNNAFDIALWNKLSPQERRRLLEYRRIDEIPFDPYRRRNTVLVERENRLKLVVRGAVEDVLPLCRKGLREVGEAAVHWANQAGMRGQRVIAVAQKKLSKKGRVDMAREERNLDFVGLVAFVDPLKKTSIEAVRRANHLGVKVKILTGDSKEVAGAVAAQIGLIADRAKVITGAQLHARPEAEQRELVEAYDVFARVSPQQKYRIIQLLQEKYEVGFLGEGINDAPALKVANVAMVVQGASDIAQEAADIVLLKKSLQVIVDGIHEGRAVFVNTVKYIKATLASNFGNFYAVAIASLLIPFLPMLPLQILLVNLLSDFPMIAIAADTIDREELRKPKSYNVREIVVVATLLGIVSTVFDFIIFGLFYRAQPAVLQTNWFIASIVTELAFLFTVRTRLSIWKAKSPSNILIALSMIGFVATIVIPYTAWGQQVFKFVPPAPIHLVMILTVVVVYFMVSESVKLMYYRMTTREANR